MWVAGLEPRYSASLPGPETLLDTLGREAFPGWFLSTSPTKPELDPTSKPPSLIPVPAAQCALLAPGTLNAQGNPGRGTGRQCHDQPRPDAAPPRPCLRPSGSSWAKSSRTHFRGGRCHLSWGAAPFPPRVFPSGAVCRGSQDPPVTSRWGTRLWARGAVAAVSGPLGLPCLLQLKLSGSRSQG